MKEMYYETELYHHGIKGQKWGVRRFQNADGTLTAVGKKRYNETLANAKQYGDNHATVEQMTRVFNDALKDAPKGTNLLVPPEIKKAYGDRVQNFIQQGDLLKKKYGEIASDVVSMDDGYDYVRTIIKDKKLNAYVEYMSLVGETKK